MKPSRTPWWKTSVVYQIYPKSFRDASGDGVGDIRGIIEKLPYLADLGVGVLWLSPVFASPMIDNGYDVSDYKAVNPLFGTMEDIHELIEEAHRRDLRLVFDIALNHTSTAHPWFQNALAGGDKRDWYFWRDGRCGAAPNNWQSIFGGPAWTQPEGQEQFYLHLFDRTQADLNWENPAVRAAIHDAMRFWLAKGVDGFRLDVVTVISKEPELRDVIDPRPGPLYRHIAGGPRLHEFLRDMRREVFSQFDCVAIGEAPGVDPARAAKLVDPADPMLDMIYHFDHVAMNPVVQKPWDRVAFKQVFEAWDKGIGDHGWNSVVLSNHDLGRVVSRFGDDAFWRESATALLALILTRRATPFLYQGDEIGMTNAPFTDIAQLDDVWAKTTFRLALEKGATPEQAFANARDMTRDHARTPMQWTADAGFTSGTPWLALNPNAACINVAAQAEDHGSIHAFVKALIALRRADALWVLGDCEDVAPEHPALYHAARRHAGRRCDVLINLSSADLGCEMQWGETLFGNYGAPYPPDRLRPWEARLIDPGPVG